jgi:hypothetical protein
MKDHANIMLSTIIEHANLRREYEPAALWVLAEALRFHEVPVLMVGRTIRFHGVEEEDDVISMIAIRYNGRLFDLWGNNDWDSVATAQQMRHSGKWNRWSMGGEEEILQAAPSMITSALPSVQSRCSDAIHKIVGLAIANLEAATIGDQTPPVNVETATRRL